MGWKPDVFRAKGAVSFQRGGIAPGLQPDRERALNARLRACSPSISHGGRWMFGVRCFGAFISPPPAPPAAENADVIRPANKFQHGAARTAETAPHRNNAR